MVPWCAGKPLPSSRGSTPPPPPPPRAELSMEEISQNSRDFKCECSPAACYHDLIVLCVMLLQTASPRTGSSAQTSAPSEDTPTTGNLTVTSHVSHVCDDGDHVSRCHKPSSSLGQWWDSDFCSPSPATTHYGKVPPLIMSPNVI